MKYLNSLLRKGGEEVGGEGKEERCEETVRWREKDWKGSYGMDD